MNSKLVILGALALLAAPLAYAHDPAGTLKNYCEPESEWLVHDYGPPATGSLLVLNEDGNLGGDCDGSGADLGDPGTPCAGFDDPDDPLTFFVGLCDSDLNRPVADWDFHNEWALGGAWLLVNPGPGTPGSGGTLDCFGADGHHAEFGSYAVDDNVLGAGVSFSIAADRVDAASEASGGTIPPAPCGDFETDESIDCIGHCVVPFGSGLDGAYIAFVQGTAGHVRDGVNQLLPQCSDFQDNDGDGLADWPLDPECREPRDDDESGATLLPECSNGRDDDNDEWVDWADVPQAGFGDDECTGPLDDES